MVLKEDKQVSIYRILFCDRHTDQLIKLDHQCSPGKLDLDPQLGRLLNFEYCGQGRYFRSPYNLSVIYNSGENTFFG